MQASQTSRPHQPQTGVISEDLVTVSDIVARGCGALGRSDPVGRGSFMLVLGWSTKLHSLGCSMGLGQTGQATHGGGLHVGGDFWLLRSTATFVRCKALHGLRLSRTQDLRHPQTRGLMRNRPNPKPTSGTPGPGKQMGFELFAAQDAQGQVGCYQDDVCVSQQCANRFNS